MRVIIWKKNTEKETGVLNKQFLLSTDTHSLYDTTFLAC